VGWIEVAQDFDGLCFCDIFEWISVVLLNCIVQGSLLFSGSIYW
jgi:hypothetical protein